MKIHGVPIYYYLEHTDIEFKHKIEIYDVDTEMYKYEKWLQENISAKDDRWCCSVWNFYFKDVEDAMAFKLRWS